MKPNPAAPSCYCRRDFLQALGVITAGLPLFETCLMAADRETLAYTHQKPRPRLLGAFLYPPTESLRQAGYWSWPGSGFDAEGRQQQYAGKLQRLAQNLGMELTLEPKPLDDAASVGAFVARVQAAKPDGLILTPFKKGHWPAVVRIVQETQLPTLVLASLGVALSDQIAQLHRRPGVYLISSADDFAPVRNGLNMIRAARWMKDARLLNIQGTAAKSTIVPSLGTEVRTIPHARFVEEYQRQEADASVRRLAAAYRKSARKLEGPTTADVLEAARAYSVLKRLLATEESDALMMECLSGLQIPHKHPPPCMGFMNLRDEGIPAGCQADLNPTLTLMLVQQLFDLPGFQQNAAMNTDRNLYFGSHCTAPSRMRGRTARPEPYTLHHHAEAGWGCVPRVLFTPGQEVTMALYQSGQKPQMLVYTGRILDSPPIPPTGGCRSNLQMTINEVSDVCDVKGMHQIIFYGNHAPELRAFCQLHNIQVVS
jgi:hypothetical protein